VGNPRLIETISSPDKTLHLIPDAYHAPLDDTDADQTLQVIMTWLQDRLPPS
jgi:alpha-beta hydrolase superfamily lysophospholipase